MGAHKVIIPLKNGKEFYFVPTKEKGERGLGLEHIIAMLLYIGQHYEEETPRFTEADVIRIVWRLLYKEEPKTIQGRGEHLKVTKNGLTPRQEAFVRHYFDTFGNGAEAARRAGYSPKRAKQTAYDLIHDRKQY